MEIQGTEMVEVVGDTEEVENAVMEGEEDAEMEMEAGEMVEEDEDETEDSPEMRALLEKGDELVLVEDHDRDSD